MQCDEKNEIPSTLGSMFPSGYYTKDTQAVVPQIHTHPSRKVVPLPVDLKGEVTEVTTVPNSRIYEIIETAMRVTKFDVAHFSHDDLLLKINQDSDLETRCAI